ncbi:hypothetical protein MPSEU_000088600 [Mayamaea pseudoterrestris]|nr:hypothetical protein MPSEU_000088600 [Mayamaea pseudoterrestris]
MWPHHPGGPPPPNSNDSSNNNNASNTTDHSSDAARAAAFAAFAHSNGFGVPFGFPPPPLDQNSSRAYSAGYVPQHPMFMTAAQSHAAFYAQQQQPPRFSPPNASGSSEGHFPPPFWGRDFASIEQPPPATSHASTDEASAIVPRGKPEAMAARLAALQVESTRQELLEEEEQQKQLLREVDEDEDDDDSLQANEDDEDEDQNDDEEEAVAEYVEDGGILANLESVPASVTSAATKTATKKKAASKPRSKSASKAASNSDSHGLPPPDTRTERLLEEAAPPITEMEYLSLIDLMVQFCKVPLLNEFSRPVALLHPELMASYSKIVSHPIDLGRVCRGIKARKYTNTRDIRLDMWRVFSNCVKFHSHPSNKDALPSFVSIGLHLRDYFNSLWDEYMIPSDLPEDASPILKNAFARRTADRKKRLDNSGVLVDAKKQHMAKTSKLLGRFIQSGACVDRLDTIPLWDLEEIRRGGRQGESDLREVVDNLEKVVAKLIQLTESEDEYTLSFFYEKLMACVPSDLFETSPAVRNRILNRLHRFLWKRFSPLHEANSRGVTQSSIWGNVAATVWARESSKKPFWPALCLGILSPPDQRESWHATVTERNESRLPEKLRTQLILARHKCEQSQAKQTYSWFLVEFLGTHVFLWVRETDIVDSFNPDDDPNKSAGHASKRKRTPRNAMHSAITSKTYATAVNECVWANDEYENTLLDAYEEDAQQEDDENETNLTFAALAEADDDIDADEDEDFYHDVETMSYGDIVEANYLLAHDGMTNFDYSKKKKPPPKKSPAKKKAPVPEKDKKEVVEAAKKAKADLAKRKLRAKEEKKEQRELERRRKKRTRDREKALKEAAARKNKRPRSLMDVDEDDRGLATDKRARASAIVKAYLLRMAKSDDEYKSLALNGVSTLPAAMIESTGLVGMALAFRAAAGELIMPDDSEDQVTKNKRPWELIDATTGKTSSERSAALEQQIKLLETEIKRVKQNATRRSQLTAEAVAKRLEMDQAIEADDLAARVNHFRKKKKASPAKPKPKSDATGLKSQVDDEVDDDDSMAAADDVEAEPVVESDAGGDAASSVAQRKESEADTLAESSSVGQRKESEADTLAESVEQSEMDIDEEMEAAVVAAASPMQAEPSSPAAREDETAAAEAMAALASLTGP